MAKNTLGNIIKGLAATEYGGDIGKISNEKLHEVVIKYINENASDPNLLSSIGMTVKNLGGLTAEQRTYVQKSVFEEAEKLGITNNTYQSENERLRSENQQLSEEKDRLNQTISDLKSQIEAKNEEIETLKSKPKLSAEDAERLKNLEEENSNLRGQLAAYSGVTPEQWMANQNAYAEKLNKLRQEQDKHDELVLQLGEKERQLGERETDLNAEQSKLNSNIQALEAAQKEYEKDKKDLENAQAELKNQQSILDQKQKDYDELVARGVTPEALEAAQKSLKEANDEVSRLNGVIKQKEKDLTAAQTAIQQVKGEKELVETTKDKDIENAKLRYDKAVKDATSEFGIKLKEKTDKDGKPVLDSHGSPVIEAVAEKGGPVEKNLRSSERRLIEVGVLSAFLAGALAFSGLATKKIIDVNDKNAEQTGTINTLTGEKDSLVNENAALQEENTGLKGQVDSMTPGYTEYTEIEAWLNGMIASGNISEDFFKDYTVVDEQGGVTITDASGLTQYIYDAAQNTITMQNADLANKQAQIDTLSDESVTLGAINDAAVTFFQNALADGYITDEEYDVFVDEETVTNEETGESETTYSVDTTTLFANDGMLYSLFVDSALTEAKLNTLEEGLESTLEIVGVIEETDENGKVVSYKTLDDYAVTDESGNVTYDTERMGEEIRTTLGTITDTLITATSGEVAEVSDEDKVLMDAVNGIVEKVGSMAEQYNELAGEKSEATKALQQQIDELTTENERLQGIINSSTKEDITTDETGKDSGETSGSNVGETGPETPEDSYGPNDTTESGDGSQTGDTNKNKNHGIVIEHE